MYVVSEWPLNGIDPERRFVNLFGEFSPLWAIVVASLDVEYSYMGLGVKKDLCQMTSEAITL